MGGTACGTAFPLPGLRQRHARHPAIQALSHPAGPLPAATAARRLKEEHLARLAAQAEAQQLRGQATLAQRQLAATQAEQLRLADRLAAQKQELGRLGEVQGRLGTTEQRCAVSGGGRVLGASRAGTPPQQACSRAPCGPG